MQSKVLLTQICGESCQENPQDKTYLEWSLS